MVATVTHLSHEIWFSVAELLFLMARFLSTTECKQAADVSIVSLGFVLHSFLFDLTHICSIFQVLLQELQTHEVRSATLRPPYSFFLDITLSALFDGFRANLNGILTYITLYVCFKYNTTICEKMKFFGFCAAAPQRLWLGGKWTHQKFWSAGRYQKTSTVVKNRGYFRKFISLKILKWHVLWWAH